MRKMDHALFDTQSVLETRGLLRPLNLRAETSPERSFNPFEDSWRQQASPSSSTTTTLEAQLGESCLFSGQEKNPSQRTQSRFFLPSGRK